MTTRLNTMRRLREENRRLREALIWASGASDFAHGGRARTGFESLVLPLLAIKVPRKGKKR